MCKKILVLLILCQLSMGIISAQDLQSTLPIVLPSSSSTSYIVYPGQNVKISSGKSITLGPGAWLQSGSTVSVKIGNAPIIPSAPNNPAVDADKNWIATKTYDDNGNLIGESKSFFDKIGKSLQEQVKSISAGHVLASQSIYDALGRPAVQTLSAPINNSGFAYKADFVTNSSGTSYNYLDFEQVARPVGNNAEGTLGWYYSNNNNLDSYVPATGYPYNRIDFYNDGSGGIKSSASVGEELKMGSNHEERSFTSPVVNELDFYLEIRNKFFPYAVVGEQPTTLKTQAVQNIVQDANGKKAVAIVDNSGKLLMIARPGSDLVVTNTITLEPEGKSVHYFNLLSTNLIRVTASQFNYKLYEMLEEQEISWNGNSNFYEGYYKLSVSGAPEETVVLSYVNSYADISYNFYNATGQLLASIAPNGVKALLTNGLNSYSTLSAIPFVSTNEYDLQGRLTVSTTTDAGRTEFAYREDGSIRFSQNSEQAKTGKFSYINYDRWGRSVEAGEYLNANLSFNAAKANENLKNNVDPDGGLIGGSKFGWVKTHYDEVNNAHGVAGYLQDEGFLTGVSWTEGEHSKTWFNYDSEGRIVWVVKSISGLGTKTVDYSFDAQGNTSKIDYQKNYASERFVHEYEYDADGRLKVAYTSTNPVLGRKEQARYYYYLHGPLKRVELAEDLQGIDYTYTLQGQLKAINHPNSSSDPGQDGTNGFAADVFGMTLEYYNGDYVRSNTGISSLATGGRTSHNGNIMGQSWRSSKPQSVISSAGSGVNNPAMVTYEYDDTYQFNNNKYGVPNFSTNNFTEIVNANRESGLSYDANGNIKTLNRSNAAGEVTANFNYNYQPNTNKLSSVDNYAAYTYDNLGQMTTQTKNGGPGFYLDYDVNGKVTSIYADPGKTQLRVSFGYDEAGIKVRKTDHIQNITTYYVTDVSGNVLAIYDNIGGGINEKEVPIYAGARIGTFNKISGNYQYELTDHLGNVRAVINENKLGNGQADVVYNSDYYPFGTPITLSNNDYRYGYQGQYAEVDKETGWNNFQLRMYDPAIGRWLSTDPYGEFYSPYVGMGNNPVSSVDPDGGYTDPEKTYNGNGGKPLNEVNITAKRWNAHQRATSRSDNGRASNYFANGKVDAGVWQMNQSYDHTKQVLASQPQFDAYVANTALILSGGEVFGLLEGSAYGLARMASIKLFSRGIAVETKVVVNSTVDLTETLATNSGGQLFLNPGAANLTQRGLDHIVLRHWFSSTGGRPAGKFLEGMTGRGLKGMINTATTKGAFRPNTLGRTGAIAEYTFDKLIGVTSKGVPTSSLRVVIHENGSVVSAFPY